MTMLTGGLWPITRPGISSVTPFTYRDGATYLEILAGLQEYIKEMVERSLEYDSDFISFRDALNVLLKSWEEKMDGEHADLTSQYEGFRDALTQIYDDFRSDNEDFKSDTLSQLIGYTITQGELFYQASMQDGGNFQAYTSAGTDKTFVKRGDTSSQVKDFGAKGDGVTDDGNAIRAAIAASAGQPIRFEAKTYAIKTGVLNLPSGTTLRMEPGTVLDFRANPTTTGFITIAGAVGADVKLVNNNIAIGVSTIGVADTSQFAVGDLVRMASNTVYDASSTGITYGEILEIDAKTPTSLTFTTPVIGGPYLIADNARIQKITPKRNILIEGGTILGAGVGANTMGIVADWSDNVLVRNLTIDSVDQRQIYFRNCVNSHVESCTFKHAVHTTQAYGVSFGDATQDSSCRNSDFSDVRHALSTNNSTLPALSGIVRRVTFDGNSVRDSSTALGGSMGGGDAIDTHTAAEDITITNNVVYSSSGSGINVECSSARVEGNTVRLAATHGIYVHPESDRFGDTVVRGNIVSDCGSYGIAVRPAARGAATTIVDMTVSDNSIRNCASAGMFIGSMTSAQGQNPKITNNSIVSAGSTVAMEIANVKGGVVVGNVVRREAAPDGFVGIRLRLCDAITATANHVNTPGVGTVGLQVMPDSTNIVATGNSVLAATKITADDGKGHNIPGVTTKVVRTVAGSGFILVDQDATYAEVAANSTITQLNGGWAGQRLTVKPSANGITVNFNETGNIILATTTVALATRRDSLTFVCASPNAWYEISRTKV